jgi:tetratricopeptide (TPR) repeat protein
MSEARAIAREAFSHFAKKEHDEAIRLYRLALDADDRFAIAWNGLSMALSQAGDLDGAIEAARRLAEIEPDDPLSHTNLSRLYQQKGLIEEAEKASAVAMQLQMRSSN